MHFWPTKLPEAIDNSCAASRWIKKIDDILVGHADAAGRYGLASSIYSGWLVPWMRYNVSCCCPGKDESARAPSGLAGPPGTRAG